MGEGKKAGDEHKFQFYDKEKGTFLGRTGVSWAKITIFYIAYFAFLAGLFTASIQLMQSQLPDDKPKLNTRLNIPGLHFFPSYDMVDDKQKARIKENEDGITFFWKTEAGEKDGYQYYIDQTNAMFKKEYTGGTPELQFSTKTLGPCSEGDGYGWKDNKPCVFFRLNRVIDWQPVGLFAPEKDTFFAKPGNGPKKPMERDATYVRCQAKDSENVIIEDFQFNYFGGAKSGEGDGYFSKDYFPYKGKKYYSDNQKSYQGPVVAVQVSGAGGTGIESEKLYKIECRAHARNIIVDTKANLGSIKFEVKNSMTN